jgi:hypothetical protein
MTDDIVTNNRITLESRTSAIATQNAQLFPIPIPKQHENISRMTVQCKQNQISATQHSLMHAAVSAINHEAATLVKAGND